MLPTELSLCYLTYAYYLWVSIESFIFCYSIWLLSWRNRHRPHGCQGYRSQHQVTVNAPLMRAFLALHPCLGRWVRTILLSAGCRAKTSSKQLFLSPGLDATTDGWPWFLSYRPRLSAACGFSNFFISSCHMHVGIFIVYRRYMMPQMERWNLWLDYSWQYYPSHIVYLIRSSLTKPMVWTIWMMHIGAKCLSNILKKLAVWSTNVISFYQL
jgi:hypothetical protein